LKDVGPLVVGQPGRVLPILLMGCEGDIRPGMMGMSGEMETVRVVFEEPGEVLLEVHAW
jgi:hypothetical protein